MSQTWVGPGRALSQYLNLPPRSTIRQLLQLVSAFVVSGIVHGLMFPPGFPQFRPLRAASFFWIQGCFVIFEVFCSGLFALVSPKRSRSPVVRGFLGMVRFAWVIGTMYYTAPMVIDELFRMSRLVGQRPTLFFKVPEKMEGFVELKWWERVDEMRSIFLT